MALFKFGHVSLVSKISQKLLKLEPWNLMNRLVAMSRWPDYAPSFEWNWWGILFCLHFPSVCLFVKLFCACHILRTLWARVLKFYIWVPNKKKSWLVFLAHLSKSSGLAIVITLCPSSVVFRRQQLVCYHSRGHSFDPILIKLGQNVCLYKI